MYLSTWDGERWLVYESLDSDMENLEPGVAASFAVAQERLDVILRGVRETEDGTAVLGPDVAPEEAPEELAVSNYVGVNGHREESRPTGWWTTLSRS